MLLALPLQFFFNGHIKILSFFIYLTINLVDYDFVYWTETFINSIWFSLVHKFQKKKYLYWTFFTFHGNTVICIGSIKISSHLTRI